jgi:hypothetical protein
MPQQAPPPPRRRPSLIKQRRAPEFARHVRKCTICRHPQRSEIETAFLSWDYVSSIVAEFHLPGRAALYRHAHAVGLLDERHRAIRRALARIIEKVQDVEPTAMAIVRAVEVFAHINDRGEWIAPRPSHPRSASRFSTARSATKSIQFRLEPDATH